MLIIVVRLPLSFPFLSGALFLLTETDFVLVHDACLPCVASAFSTGILASQLPVLLGCWPFLRAPAGVDADHALLFVLGGPDDPVIRCALVEELFDVAILLDLRLAKAELLSLICNLRIS